MKLNCVWTDFVLICYKQHNGMSFLKFKLKYLIFQYLISQSWRLGDGLDHGGTVVRFLAQERHFPLL
jgi:hypothetical protein